MPNVTITASAEVLRRLRIEAATNNVSMSRFVGEILNQKFTDDDAYEQAMTDLFSRGPYLRLPPRDDGRTIPTRTEIYDRPVLK